MSWNVGVDALNIFIDPSEDLLFWDEPKLVELIETLVAFKSNSLKSGLLGESSTKTLGSCKIEQNRK